MFTFGRVEDACRRLATHGTSLALPIMSQRTRLAEIMSAPDTVHTHNHINGGERRFLPALPRKLISPRFNNNEISENLNHNAVTKLITKWMEQCEQVRHGMFIES